VTDVLPGGRPKDLVPGDADGVERLAARLDRFAIAARAASIRLTGAEPEHWSGQAAQLFRAAVGPVPRQLARAGAAFAAAARALTGYAAALRAAQAAATSAIRLVEQSTVHTRGQDQEAARRLVERARAELAEAARVAAARLAEAAADAPVGSGVRLFGLLPAVCADDGTTVRAVAEHRLAHPDRYLAPLDELTDSVHFGQVHDVGFAAAGLAAGRAGAPAAGPADWQEWAGQSADRGLGRVEPGVLGGLDVAAGPVTIGRGRRDRTAFALLGLDEAEIRRRRERYGGPRHRDGVAAPARSGRLHSADAWRSRLASAPRAAGAVHAWGGPEGNPLPRARSAEAVPLTPVERQVGAIVPRTGQPADEGQHPGSGRR
jgi:hypothetical protein